MEEYPLQYYIVVDGQSTGPFSLEEILHHPRLTPDAMVWKPGLENWVAAHTMPELHPGFAANEPHKPQMPPEYTQNNSPEYRDYTQTSRNETNGFNQFANNPQYQENHTYNNRRGYHEHNQYHDPYHNGPKYNPQYRPSFRTNWLPWAIVATVFGFFTSCIGAIFGIIGIVQANKANGLYARGFDTEGDAANSNAKVMTIIGLIFAGLGILFLIFFGNIFSGFSNLSYY